MGNHGTATWRACAFLPALLAACAADTGYGTTERAIIGGQPVAGDDLPAVGAIQTNAGSICTGTLISPTAVLTAAHCVDPMILKAAIQQSGGTPPDTITYQFTFARDARDVPDAELLEVESVECHDRFLADLAEVLAPPPTRWNDIALMHLAEPVTDRSVQPLAPADVVAALEPVVSHLESYDPALLRSAEPC
jgi:secreted trypsin-like serine protease